MLDTTTPPHLPDTLFGEPVKAWRWLPQRHDAHARPVWLLRLLYLPTCANGVQAVLAERDPKTRTTCKAVQQAVAALPPDGMRREVYGDENAVYVNVFCTGGDL